MSEATQEEEPNKTLQATAGQLAVQLRSQGRVWPAARLSVGVRPCGGAKEGRMKAETAITSEVHLSRCVVDGSSRQQMSDMKRVLVLVQIVSLAFTTTGCGTAISGTHQQVRLNMDPPGTQVAVYRLTGEPVAGPATSPGTMRVHRPVWRRPYLVRASKDGYCPRYWLTDANLSAGGKLDLVMVWGGIIILAPLLVGAVSVLVDSSTGGCCSMDPDHFDSWLQEDKACAE